MLWGKAKMWLRRFRSYESDDKRKTENQMLQTLMYQIPIGQIKQIFLRSIDWSHSAKCKVKRKQWYK